MVNFDYEGDSFVFRIVDDHNSNEIERRNYFVRLHPKVAQALYLLVTKKLILSNCLPELLPGETGWTLGQDQRSEICTSGIEFLPLAVALIPEGDKARKTSCAEKYLETFYTSYNGGDLHSECSSENSISIPDCFNLTGLLRVRLQVLDKVVDAKELLIEPATIGDWELIEKNAAWLESGGLLEQISIVYPDQVIQLFLKGGLDVAYIRVQRDNFRKSRYRDDLSIWPEQDECGCDWNKSQHACLRLVANTQVVVIPKERRQDKGQFSPWLRIVSSFEEYQNDSVLQRLSQLLETPVVAASVPYNSLVVHPTTLLGLHPFTLQCNVDTVDLVRLQTHHAFLTSSFKFLKRKCTAAYAIIRSSYSIPENCCAIHPFLQMQLQATPHVDSVRFYVTDKYEVENDRERIGYILENSDKLIRLQEVIMQPSYINPQTWMEPTVPLLEQLCMLNRDYTCDTFHRESQLPLEIGKFLSFSLKGERKIFKTSLETVKGEYSAASFDDSVQCIDVDTQVVGTDNCGDIPLSRSLSLHPNPKALSESLIAALSPGTTIFWGHQYVFKSFSPHLSTILYGEPGSGKTTTALLFASYYIMHYRCTRIYVNCKKLKSLNGTRIGNVMDELLNTICYSKMVAPVVVVLDDLDELLGSVDTGSEYSEGTQEDSLYSCAIEHTQLIRNSLQRFLRLVKGQNFGVIRFVLTCRSADFVTRWFAGDEYLWSCLEIPRMTLQDRVAMFCQKYSIISEYDDIDRLCDKLEEYRPCDIDILFRRIKYQNKINDHNVDALSKEFGSYRPLASLGFANQRAVEVLSWNDLGGLFEAKRSLVDAIIRPSTFRLIYKCAKIKLPRGVLLFGPPGTGKSLIPIALAKECKYQLVICKGPEILDKYVGASELKVRELFNRAKKLAPSLVFFDDIDSLAPKRGSDQTGVTDRIVNQLLTFLDGAEDVSNGELVYIISASSRPDKLDPALLRPGRLEKHVYIGYSETKEEWTDLFLKVSYSFDLAADLQTVINSGTLYDTICCKDIPLPYFSGADIMATLNCARLLAVREVIANATNKERVQMDLNHVLTAFNLSKPSLSKEELDLLTKLYAPFRRYKLATESSGTNDSLRVAFL